MPVRAHPPVPAGDPLPRLERLGRRIEQAWERHHYDEDALPALAAGLLEADVGANGLIAARPLLDHVLCSSTLPEQVDLGARFSQLPLTVYQGRRFFIQVLYWLWGTTVIHAHDFSGAFMVLEGMSVHRTYSFVSDERLSGRLLLGQLTLRACEPLLPGTVRRIDRPLIHSTFHLDTPTVSLVVRTHHDARTLPQYEYRLPSLALDPLPGNPALTRQLQVLDLLAAIDADGHRRAVAALLAGCDSHTAFRVVERLASWMPEAELLELLGRRVRRRHPELMARLPAVLAELGRERRLETARARTGSDDARTLLGLLLCVPSQKALARVLAARAPGDRPAALLERGLAALEGPVREILGLDDGLLDAARRALGPGARRLPRGERARLLSSVLAPLVVP
jgi:hypothetical protein